MEIIADLGEKSGGDYIFDRKYLFDVVRELQDLLLRMVKALNLIASDRFYELYSTLDRVFLPMEGDLRGRLSLPEAPYVVSLRDAPPDNPELIGGKASLLSEIIHRMNIPVPDGFVFTTHAYYRFLAYNGLQHRIHGWLETWTSGKEDVSWASGQIRYSILAGIVPQDVIREIKQRGQKPHSRWALRSSAYGEDGELSFAGLHESVLNVPPESIPEAYKKVLASLYSPEALVYRQKMAMIGEEAAMPVLCQEMIASASSGVVQTVCMEKSDPDCLTIHASLGLGRTAMEGRSSLDRFVIEKRRPYVVKSREIASKELLIRGATGGGEEEVPVAEEMRMESSISEDVIQVLVRWAVTLERYFKRPQEIEWAVDAAGSCWLLQCRHLVFPESFSRSDEDLCESCSVYPVLIADRGVVAHTGVGAGRVYTVHNNDEMSGFPEGAVLVTPYTAPWLAQIVPKASAIIAERGSVAGHLATIAREFRVPALVGVAHATDVLRDGAEITLDTYHRIVYAGRVNELLQYELLHSAVFEESPEFRLLRRLLRRIAPLHLIDPQSPEFSPAGCTSVHDMIRFIHEKSVQELIDFCAYLHADKTAKVWTLDSHVPMDLKIVDLGDGIDPESSGDKLREDQIVSLPLAALWKGISQLDTWSTEPVHVDFKGLMSSLTRNWDAAGDGISSAGFNLAVVNRIYMNLHLRLGYHFNLIDARMHDEPQHNHIYFRFVGGVTDITRRSRRAQVLAKILSRLRFNVVIKGDLVVARLLHLPKEEIGECLQVLGALIGYTRQLDIQLRNDGDITRFVEQFFTRHAHLAHSLT